MEGYIYKEDLKELASKLKEQDSLLRLKRRWLMDLPLSTTEETRVEQLLSANTILPESLLREDDVSYEDIKNCVEMGFGVHKHGKQHHGFQEPVQIFKSSDDCKDIFFLLDAMTNKGLYSLCKTLTGGTVKFEKTKCNMRKTIKEQLRKIISDKTDSPNTLLEQLSELVNNPNNFLDSQLVVSTSPEAYRDAANKVLNGLEDLCTRTLNAMHRKLIGVKGVIPTLQMKQYKKGRNNLINLIRETCGKMITDLSKGRKPAEKLASALGIASLALKHLLNCPVAVNFRNFSPEVEALQNDITKSIWLLSKTRRVSMMELRRVQLLLDPTVDLNTRLRTGIRNLLTEYLFECGDMDVVPDSLMKTLSIINGKTMSQSRRKKCLLSPQDMLKDEMQKEIECVSSLSAQAKQVLLDSLQKHEFDDDFARAYMENFEERNTFVVSDDDDDDDGMTMNGSIHCEFDYYNLQNEAESIGETTPPMSSSPVSTSHPNCRSPAHSPYRSLNSPLGSRSINEMDLDEIQSRKESDVQSGHNMKRKYNSTINLEMDSLDPHNAASMRNLFSAPPSFAMDSSTNECKTEEFKVELSNIDSLQSWFSNAYLEIQEACDATSIVAYRFVGQKLQRLAGTELFQGDRLYLQSGASIPECSEESSESLLTAKLTGMWKDVLEH